MTAVLSDYGSYSKFMPHFVTSRVLAQRGSQALLYIEVAALHGAAKLWAQMKLSLVETSTPTRVIKAKMLKGNLKGFDAEWQVTPVDDQRTLVAFELCADPDFHLPFGTGIVSDYNEKEARSSIAALRKQVAKTPES